MKRVLVVPSGTEIGLEIHEALSRRRDIELIGAESTANSHAAWVFDINLRVPRFDEADFVQRINAIVAEYAVDYIFPAHDDVQLALMEHSHAIGCAILSPPLDTVRITRYKSRTYEWLNGVVPVPLLLPHDVRPSATSPVFVKPDRGQGSLHAVKCNSPKELHAALALAPDMLVCEYLPGAEVTVDCFSDRDRGVLYASARERVRVRAGISVRAQAAEFSDAKRYASEIHHRLHLQGAWFFQCKRRSSGDWAVLEVGPRIPGGATFSRMRDVNLALLTIFEHERMHIEITPNAIAAVMDRAFVSRFRANFDFATLYVDFDDTLMIKGTPNFELVALLVAARHYGKRVVLLTRNEGSCHGWLQRYALTGLFDEVITLDRASPKHHFMHEPALLIDDSFAERKACRQAGMQSVDVDCVPMLLEHLRHVGATSVERSTAR